MNHEDKLKRIDVLMASPEILELEALAGVASSALTLLLPNQKTMQHQITITFPSAAHKQTFAEWMCDGGGECGYMDSLEHHGHAGVSLGYHGPENEEYPKNDKRRYGPFMVDDTIRVTLADDEESAKGAATGSESKAHE